MRSSQPALQNGTAIRTETIDILSETISDPRMAGYVQTAKSIDIRCASMTLRGSTFPVLLRHAHPRPERRDRENRNFYFSFFLHRIIFALWTDGSRSTVGDEMCCRLQNITITAEWLERRLSFADKTS